MAWYEPSPGEKLAISEYGGGGAKKLLQANYYGGGPIPTGTFVQGSWLLDGVGEGPLDLTDPLNPVVPQDAMVTLGLLWTCDGSSVQPGKRLDVSYDIGNSGFDFSFNETIPLDLAGMRRSQFGRCFVAAGDTLDVFMRHDVGADYGIAWNASVVIEPS